ncbi:MAG: hypothetical protein IKJ24_00695, partial [Clostridia bacterium]|nr:hypothetical protein [Clostridia bacterium]
FLAAFLFCQAFFFGPLVSKKKAGKGIRFAYVAKGEPPLVCSPSFGYAEIHPFVALSNDKEVSPLASGDQRSARWMGASL